MKLARIASVVLSCIAMGSTQVEGTSISITNGKEKKKGKRVFMPFGKRMIVEFDVDKKDLNDYVYIGVFQNLKKKGSWLWQHTCGNQDSFGKKSCKKGTIVFEPKDPNEDGYEQLPLPPGNWHVCLMDVPGSLPGVVLACARLTILPLDTETPTEVPSVPPSDLETNPSSIPSEVPSDNPSQAPPSSSPSETLTEVPSVPPSDLET